MNFYDQKLHNIYNTTKWNSPFTMAIRCCNQSDNEIVMQFSRSTSLQPVGFNCYEQNVCSSLNTSQGEYLWNYSQISCLKILKTVYIQPKFIRRIALNPELVFNECLPCWIQTNDGGCASWNSRYQGHNKGIHARVTGRISYTAKNIVQNVVLHNEYFVEDF